MAAFVTEPAKLSCLSPFALHPAYDYRGTFLIAPTGENGDLYSNLTRAGNSGVDLRFPADVVIPPTSETGGLPTKVNLQVKARAHSMMQAYYPYLLYPRSSIAKTPLSLANSVGVFDCDYTGEVIVALRNHSPAPYAIARGTSLFQLVWPDMRPSAVMVCPADGGEFAGTARGAGGFGSTGVGGVGGVGGGEKNTQ